MVVEFFEVVIGGWRWFYVVVGGFRSFHVLVTTNFIPQTTSYKFKFSTVLV